MRNINVWEKAGSILKVTKVMTQVAGIGMVVVTDKVLDLVKRKAMKKIKNF